MINLQVIEHHSLTTHHTRGNACVGRLKVSSSGQAYVVQENEEEPGAVERRPETEQDIREVRVWE